MYSAVKNLLLFSSQQRAQARIPSQAIENEPEVPFAMPECWIVDFASCLEGFDSFVVFAEYKVGGCKPRVFSGS